LINFHAEGSRLSVGTGTISGMEPMSVVRELWDRIQARDWAGVGELLAEDAVVEWPVSGERIVGRDNYVSINAQYPEGWSIHVLRIVADGEMVVSEVDVPHVDMGEFRVVSFWIVRDGLIAQGREYWTTPGADEAPQWRAQYVQRM
jgi:ketosteroid isomerase-like protein